MSLTDYPSETRNLFKRQDVFRCRHDSHSGFSYAVSVWHVMEEKECYPEGCVYFRWHCKKIETKKKCHRNYSTPGRFCYSCQSFYDTKEIYRPEVILGEREWEDFQREYRRFKWWVEELREGSVSFLGTVEHVKPRMLKILQKRGCTFRQRGFLVKFSSGFLGRTRFEDSLYMKVGRGLQRRIGFKAGMEVEADVEVRLSKGRFLLTRPKRISSSPGDPARDGLSLLNYSPFGSRTFQNQPSRCVACEAGVLVDVLDGTDNERFVGRELLCLDGVPSPELCTRKGALQIKLENCTRESRTA